MNKEKRRTLIFILSLIFLFSCFYNIRKYIPTKAIDTNAPTFSGVNNITIERGSNFDVLDGVTANSSLYGDLTAKIVVNGKVDVKTTGEYIVEYSVADKNNTIGEATRIVKVIDFRKTEIIGNETFFSVYGKDPGSPEFKITFDKNKKTLKVVDIRNVDNISDDFYDSEYFNFFLYNKYGKEKNSVTLLGCDEIISMKLKFIDEVPFEYGDYIKILIGNEDNIKLGGNLKGLRPYYFRYRDIKFHITEQGLKAEDTALGLPINVQFNDNFVVNKGEIFDPLENVYITNEYEESYMDKVKVSGVVNTNIPGKYKIKYYVVDGMKESVYIDRTIIVEDKKIENKIIEDKNKLRNIEGNYPTLKLINHNRYFRSIDRKVNKFIIKFKAEGGANKRGRRIKRE